MGNSVSWRNEFQMAPTPDISSNGGYAIPLTPRDCAAKLRVDVCSTKQALDILRSSVAVDSQSQEIADGK